MPGSQQPITDEAARQEYAKAEAAMKTSVDWFRKECAASEARAMGRVTPALLSPVRVKLPDNPKPMKLEDLATVGVREGTTLLVTLFNEHVGFVISYFTCLTNSALSSSIFSCQIALLTYFILVDRETR